MESDFWLQRWEKNRIAFHEHEANPILVNYFKRLSLAKEARVFVPLCGKTLDIAWLLSKGYRVVGVELIEIAVEQLFAELGVEPEISTMGGVTHYHEKNIDLFVGSIFDISRPRLGAVEAIYDRAAFVALPEAMRQRYAAHVMEMTNLAPQLLITYEYDQRLLDGPPFSISTAEVHQRYGSHYDLSLLESIDIPGGLKGTCPAKENVWLLHPKPEQVFGNKEGCGC